MIKSPRTPEQFEYAINVIYNRANAMRRDNYYPGAYEDYQRLQSLKQKYAARFPEEYSEFDS